MKSFKEYTESLVEVVVDLEGSALNEEIDWDKVKQAAVNAAKDIHGEPDMKIIDGIIGDTKSDGDAKDTEDAIQIVIDKMR